MHAASVMLPALLASSWCAPQANGGDATAPELRSFVTGDRLRLGTESRNPMGAPCFATPAISEGVLIFRTTERLVAIAPPPPAPDP